MQLWWAKTLEILWTVLYPFMASRTAFWEVAQTQMEMVFWWLTDRQDPRPEWKTRERICWRSGGVQLWWFCSLRTVFPLHSFTGQEEDNHTNHKLLLKKQCTKNDTEDLEYSARAPTVKMVFSLSFWMFDSLNL